MLVLSSKQVEEWAEEDTAGEFEEEWTEGETVGEFEEEWTEGETVETLEFEEEWVEEQIEEIHIIRAATTDCKIE